MSREDLVLLLSSPMAGAGTAKGSGVQIEARRIGDQMHRRNTTEENEEIDIGRRHEAQRLSL